MRRPFEQGTRVTWKGKRYQVEIDYEDWVYLIGIEEPVPGNEIKLTMNEKIRSLIG